MKTKRIISLLSLITILVLSLAVIPACNEDVQEEEAVNVDQLSTVEIKVEGMTCTGCENTVTNAIMELSGINHAKLSHIDGNAVVEFDGSKTNKEEIVNAINESGYKVVE